MQFYSMGYFLFVIISVILYYTVFRKKQWILLLLANLAFYVYLAGHYVGIVVGLSFSIWVGGLILTKWNAAYKIEKKNKELTRDDKKRLKKKLTTKKRAVLAVEIIIAIGLLALFKIQNYSGGLLFPMGLSFYTFQALSYFFDIYNDKYAAETNFLHYLTFVSWFPQMLQGPISRYDSLGTQMFAHHDVDWNMIKHATYRMAFGLMKKYAIADIVSESVNAIFANGIEGSTGSVLFFGMLMATLREYANFSGGIDMTLAVSEYFGLELVDNFRQPYFAKSMAEFWRRWHITLGSWMRDYVFYPFAVTKPMLALVKWGTKKFGPSGRILAAAVGNVVVFLLVGIWHGTGWNYVVWGLYNGLLIAVSELLKPVYNGMFKITHINENAKWFQGFRMIRTALLVALGELMVMLSIQDFPVAVWNFIHRPDWKMLGIRMILNDHLVNHSSIVAVVLVLALILMVFRSIVKERGIDLYAKIDQSNIVIRWGSLYLVLFVFLAAFVYMSGEGGFLYANF